MNMKCQLILLSIACLAGVAAQAAPEKPNVVFIFADDMSYETIGAYGMLDIDTPNLDTLVERGATFTHAYNMGAWGGAVCVASRAMLNTGRFVWQANAAEEGKYSEYVQNNRMWSQRMKQAGYQTYMTGKWHVPVSPASVFDVTKDVRGGMPNQTPQGYNRPKSPADYEAGWKPWETKYGGFWKGGTHWSVVVADDGIEFLNQAARDDQPFFMYLAFNAGHDPRQSPKEYIDRYPLDRIKLPENFLPQYPYADAICGLGLRDEKLMPYPRTEYAVKVNRQEYFAGITYMDEQIGRILQALEESGKADNTYIVFTADHGLAVGHHGLTGKQNMYDDSVRAPFMIVGPDIKPGLKIDAPIYLQDAMATSLDLAGAPADGIDFKSLLPLLHGEADEHYPEIYGAYMNRQRMITKGDWKFISYPTIGVERLFNLKKDPNEMNDLAGNPEYAPKMDELRAALLLLGKEMNDPLGNGQSAVSGPSKKPGASKKAVIVSQPAADGTIVLKASDATLHPSAQNKIEYDTSKNRIGGWLSPDATVEWSVHLDEPGTYAVAAEVGVAKPALWTLSFGDEQVDEYTLPSTGGYKSYKTVQLGTVIAEAGEHQLILTPVKSGWQPLNLRSMSLTPVQ
jgi:choline-sulfatase